MLGRGKHVSEFFEFSDSLPAQTILEWMDIVEQWEKDNKETNPFVVTNSSA